MAFLWVCHHLSRLVAYLKVLLMGGVRPLSGGDQGMVSTQMVPKFWVCFSVGGPLVVEICFGSFLLPTVSPPA